MFIVLLFFLWVSKMMFTSGSPKFVRPTQIKRSSSTGNLIAAITTNNVSVDNDMHNTIKKKDCRLNILYRDCSKAITHVVKITECKIMDSIVCYYSLSDDEQLLYECLLDTLFS